MGLFVACLGVEDLDKGQHVLERDIALDGVGRCEDISAIFAGLQQLSGLSSDVLDRAIGQSSLGG